MSIRLHIPEPCHESWQHMQPNKDGRHCMACRKTVVDFSNMTDREILDHISRASGEVCGRVDKMQLNRGLKENNLRKKSWLLFVWNLLIVVFVFGGKAKAQGGIKYQKVVQVKKDRPEEFICVLPKPRIISGIVKNGVTGEPVSYASVILKGTQQGVSADSAGKFLLEVPEIEDNYELEISSLGFELASFNFSKSEKTDKVYFLSPEADELQKFEFVRDPTVKGAIRCGYVISRWYRLGREVNELLPKKDIVVYPNPINAGNNIQAALQLKEKGEYRLDLMDASGRVVWMRTLNISEAKYNLSIPTQSLWSAGVYWLRISGRHTKKIYHGKIVLQ
jgi:hypothetical protein